jgi:hypothetical protein
MRTESSDHHRGGRAASVPENAMTSPPKKDSGFGPSPMPAAMGNRPQCSLSLIAAISASRGWVSSSMRRFSVSCSSSVTSSRSRRSRGSTCTRYASSTALRSCANSSFRTGSSAARGTGAASSGGLGRHPSAKAGAGASLQTGAEDAPTLVCGPVGAEDVWAPQDTVARKQDMPIERRGSRVMQADPSGEDVGTPQPGG